MYSYITVHWDTFCWINAPLCDPLCLWEGKLFLRVSSWKRFDSSFPCGVCFQTSIWYLKGRFFPFPREMELHFLQQQAHMTWIFLENDWIMEGEVGGCRMLMERMCWVVWFPSLSGGIEAAQVRLFQFPWAFGSAAWDTEKPQLQTLTEPACWNCFQGRLSWPLVPFGRNWRIAMGGSAVQRM